MVPTRDSMNIASYNNADKFICKDISVSELCQTGGWWCFNSITQSQKRRSAVHLLVGELKLQRVDWQLAIINFDKCYIFTAILSPPPIDHHHHRGRPNFMNANLLAIQYFNTNINEAMN